MVVPANADELLTADRVEIYEEPVFVGEKTPADLEREERAERRKRHVRLFCFSCNRYEGHSIAARSRLLYSFLLGITFGGITILADFRVIAVARYGWVDMTG